MSQYADSYVAFFSQSGMTHSTGLSTHTVLRGYTLCQQLSNYKVDDYKLSELSMTSVSGALDLGSL